jgi:hypothetical protein
MLGISALTIKAEEFFRSNQNSYKINNYLHTANEKSGLTFVNRFTTSASPLFAGFVYKLKTSFAVC